MKRTTVAVSALLLLSLSPVRAAMLEEDPPPAGENGSPERSTKELFWHTDLKKALSEASAQHKLVFWVQMLGRIDGPT